MLEVRDLSVRFGGLLALDRVSFDVREGEVLSLIGPNGAGKTTAFNAVSGYLAATGGEILFRGTSLGGLENQQHRRARAWSARSRRRACSATAARSRTC
jgi:ABC-type branched-subunit amino acid transport system ATPase component